MERGEWNPGVDPTAPGARDTRTRARRARATGGAPHPASLTPQGSANPGGLGDLTPLPACTRGRWRLLRLLRARRGPAWPRSGRRYGQGHAGSPGHGHDLRYAAGRRPVFELAWRGTQTGQRGVVCPYPTQYVCHLLLRSPGSRGGSLSYANAGHDLPYLRRGDHAEQLRARECPWA